GRLDDRAAARALETVERNARHQAQLIEDLLDVSRIVAGKLRLDVRKNTELIPILEEAIETVRPAAEQKGIRLEVALDPGAGPVAGDPDRLQQVFANLLANSVKFTHPGGRVGVTLRRDNERARVEIADDGQGISP